MKDNNRPKHPSGRPRHDNRTRSLSIMRYPGEGSYLPRLQQRGLKDAIGFTHDVRTEPDDESNGD